MVRFGNREDARVDRRPFPPRYPEVLTRPLDSPVVAKREPLQGLTGAIVEA